MLLNNKHITSLENFRKYFNFFEVWHKISAFIRDLSPSEIFYGTASSCGSLSSYIINLDDILLYNAIANPDDYKFKDSQIISESVIIQINLLEEEVAALENVPAEETVRVIAMSRLAKVNIPSDISTLFNEINVEDEKCIILSNGANIKISEHYDKNKNLITRPIKVAKSSKLSSRVGDFTLNPGQCTYGVFCGNKLIAVSPNQLENKKYHLSYEERNGTIYLVAIERSSTMEVAKWANATYVTLIGETNFAIINETSVLVFENEDLNNKLRREIERAFFPSFLKFEDNKLTVFYSNSGSISFKV